MLLIIMLISFVLRSTVDVQLGLRDRVDSGTGDTAISLIRQMRSDNLTVVIVKEVVLHMPKIPYFTVDSLSTC